MSEFFNKIRHVRTLPPGTTVWMAREVLPRVGDIVLQSRGPLSLLAAGPNDLEKSEGPRQPVGVDGSPSLGGLGRLSFQDLQLISILDFVSKFASTLSRRD